MIRCASDFCPKVNRELTVGSVAGAMITFAAWAWGGVVLWTQWLTAALGLLALVISLLPSTREKWRSRPLRHRLAFSIAGGIAVLLFIFVRRLLEIQDLRTATRQLIPNADLPPLTFSDWGEIPLLIGLGTALFLSLLTGLLRPSGARRRLIRFWPFWLGIFLFSWIACQSLNPWGKVIQRDLYWHIVPQDYIAWLPSGLDAPLDSTEEPGGMNGWRQLLILIGPWALLCALHISIQRRRVFGWLALVVCLNGLGVALAGNLALANRWRDFLGFSVEDLHSPPFGPFAYKNHAGAWLSLAAGLTLALMFHSAKRRGDKVDRGGPHLIVALAAFFLVLGAASTMSLAAAMTAGALLFVVAPLAYLLDRDLRANLPPIPVLALVALAGVVGYAALLGADARKWRAKVESKQQTMARLGGDDRGPLRRATWLMVGQAPLPRVVSGYGAGSYRWISPAYMAAQEEFTDKKGQLTRRATHAHNDWLQCVVELGFAGCVGVLAALVFLLGGLRAAILNPSAVQLCLIGCVVLYSIQAFFDFLLFGPHLLLLAVLVAWQRLSVAPASTARLGQSPAVGPSLLGAIK